MTLSVHFDYMYAVVALNPPDATLGEKVTPGGHGDRTFESTNGDSELFELGEVLRVPGIPGSPWAYVGQNSEGIFLLRGGQFFLSSNNPNLDNTHQTYYEINATCFLEGVHIACEHGEVAVEDLNIGDRIRLADGSLASIRWIGRQTWLSLFADPLSVLPVRIAAGALAEGVPSRDLYLSPDHAVLVDGVLVHAGALVNGTTITRMTRRELPERFRYFHIELDAHAVVLAEGCPCESFVANVGRARFENFSQYLELFGEEQPTEELDLPRAKSARQVPSAIRAVIAERADALRFPGLAAA